MKLYEVISFNRELLRRLSSVGIRLDDCKYIDLYEDYRKLREGGGGEKDPQSGRSGCKIRSVRTASIPDHRPV